MSDEKPDLSRTEVGRMIEAEMKDHIAELAQARKSRPTAMLAKVGEAHEANPIFAGIVGLGLMGVSGWVLYTFHPTDKVDLSWKLGIGLLGFFTLPNVARSTASQLGAFLSVVAPFLPFLKKNGSSGPTSPPSEPQ